MRRRARAGFFARAWLSLTLVASGLISTPTSASAALPSAPGSIRIATSFGRACALDSTGKIWCWGLRQNGTRTSTPEALGTSGAPSTYASITAGYDHFCALTSGGAAWCWGNNSDGQLGAPGGGYESAVPLAVNTADALPDAYVAISGGTNYTCGIAVGGTAWCWGANGAGQLGDGSTTPSSDPVLVDTSNGRPATYSQIEARSVTTCGLTAAGVAWCWGSDYFGTLGNGDDGSVGIPDPNMTSPVQVATGGLLPTTYKSLSGGSGHFCGIASDDTAWCWGRDGNGRLGDGTTTATGDYAFAPSAVDKTGPLPDTYGALTATGNHTCGLSLTDGAAYCWGSGTWGQLGGGSFLTEQESPAPVVTTGTIPDGYASIDEADNYTCALAADASIWCWGRDYDGVLGQGGATPGTNSAAPVKVTAWPPPVSLTVTLAGAGTGSVVSSPAGIDCGSTCTFGFTPGTVTLTATAAAGSDFSGWSGGGCSGTGTCVISLSSSTSVTATFVSNSGGWASVAAGNYSTCALSQGGVAYCWGANDYGGLGNGGADTATGTPTPVTMPPGARFTQVTTGTYIGCALDQGGAAWCWGWDEHGQLGNGLPAAGSSVPVPVTMPDGVTFTSISAGRSHVCASGSNGKAYCWGLDSSGQLGNGSGSSSDVTSPGEVPSLASVALVSAGYTHSCALTTVGGVWCWGAGGGGGLGIGSTVSQSSPVAVTLAKVATSLEAGFSRTCVTASDGSAYCWGDDGHGGVGDGGAADQYGVLSPAVVVLPSGRTFRQVSTRFGAHSCAVADNGAGYCWGYDGAGELGNGQAVSADQLVPYPVTMPSGVTFTSISAGGGYTCARASGGSVYCWGSDSVGQVGDGTIQGTVRYEPHAVAAPTAGHALGLTISGSGSVASQPLGLSCSSSPCSATFDHGLRVVLTATGTGGQTFSSWSGGCEATSGNQCTVLMTAARSVTATFAAATSTLTVSTAGGGSITSSTGGIDCPGTCSASITNGTLVTLTATVATGASFGSWTGCTPVGGTPSQCTVTVSSATSVSATFKYPVSVAFSGNGSGAVSSSPAGFTSCSSIPCSASFDYGQTVTLTASPAGSSEFTSWSGCTPVVGTPTQCTVAATAVRSVTLTFTLKIYFLTVSTVGGGTISVNTEIFDCSSVCSAAYYHGTTVPMAATPATGASFGSWTGCTPVVGTPTECTITMTDFANVSATFKYPVSVTFSGTGSGTVTSSPAGISCSAAPCSASFNYGQTVTLTAEASEGSSFTSWSGCTPVIGVPTQCTVAATAVRSVTATFILESYPLLVSLVGEGGTVTSTTGAIDCGVTCSDSFLYGSTVRLQAAVTTGYTFVGWSDNCTPVQADPTKCDVVIGTSNTVTATFSSTSVSVSVTPSGQGSGSVVSAPAGIACPSTCSANFTYGDSVALTATPAAGSTFTGWSGGCEGTGSCTVIAGVDDPVGAAFGRTPYPLTVVVSGPGTVTSSPGGISACAATCSFTFQYGQVVTLTASAVGEGSSFKGWSPNCTSTGEFTCTISVTSAKTVSAFFASAGDTVGLAASGPAVAATGGLIAFTVTVSNFTLSDISGATLTVATTLQVSTAGCSGTGPYTCALPTLASGSRTFKVYATAPAVVGSASATFTVLPPTPPSDSVTSNNAATVTVPVESDLLSLKVGTYPSASSSGALLSYTVDIRNGSGVATATGLVLRAGFDDAGVATSGAACSLDTTPAPGYAASVSCPLADLATSTTRSVLFQIYGPATVSGTLLHSTLWVTSADTGGTDTSNDTDGPFETAVSPPPPDGAATVAQAVEVPTTATTDISTVTQDGLSSTDQTGTQLSLPSGFSGTVESQEVKEGPSARVATDLSFAIQGGLSTARGKPVKADPVVFTCTGSPAYSAECWRFDITIEESVAARFVYTFTFLFDGSAFTASSGTLLGIKNVAFFHKGDALGATFVQVPACPRRTTADNYSTNVPGGGPCLQSKKVNAAGDYVFVVLTDTNGQWKGGR